MTRPEPTEDREVETASERRARLADVFGDVLPDTTADERDADVRGDRDGDDAWLRSQVPPHHGS